MKAYAKLVQVRILLNMRVEPNYIWNWPLQRSPCRRKSRVPCLVSVLLGSTGVEQLTAVADSQGASGSGRI